MTEFYIYFSVCRSIIIHSSTLVIGAQKVKGSNMTITFYNVFDQNLSMTSSHHLYISNELPL